MKSAQNKVSIEELKNVRDDDPKIRELIIKIVNKLVTT